MLCGSGPIRSGPPAVAKVRASRVSALVTIQRAQTRLERGRACARTAPENTKIPIRLIVDWRTQMRVDHLGARRIGRAVNVARARIAALTLTYPNRA